MEAFCDWETGAAHRRGFVWSAGRSSLEVDFSHAYVSLSSSPPPPPYPPPLRDDAVRGVKPGVRSGYTIKWSAPGRVIDRASLDRAAGPGRQTNVFARSLDLHNQLVEAGVDPDTSGHRAVA